MKGNGIDTTSRTLLRGTSSFSLGILGAAKLNLSERQSGNEYL